MTGLDDKNAPHIGGRFKDAVEHQPLPGEYGGKPAPFSIRLTAEERDTLRKAAGKTPLGAYIRSTLLGSAAKNRRTYRRPVEDEKALAKLLGALGEAKLSNNLNQLAKAANTGSLPVTPDTERDLRQACKDVAWMRAVLMNALGIDKPRGRGPS